MASHRQTPGETLQRGLTLLALAAALSVAAWALAEVTGANDEDEDVAPARVTLGDVVAHPERYVGTTVAVTGRVRRRTGRSYELKPPRRKKVLLVRRDHSELRPYARRRDRIEVIGELRGPPAGAPKRVAATLAADEVLLFDRAAPARRGR